MRNKGGGLPSQINDEVRCIFTGLIYRWVLGGMAAEIMDVARFIGEWDCLDKPVLGCTQHSMLRY